VHLGADYLDLPFPLVLGGQFYLTLAPQAELVNLALDLGAAEAPIDDGKVALQT
jgi:hypothetical protein